MGVAENTRIEKVYQDDRSLIAAMKIPREVLGRLAKKIATLLTISLTLFFLLIFGLGQSSVPGGDLALKVAWGLLFVGLVEFLKASWKPSIRWARVIRTAKWSLVMGGGMILALMGIVAGIVAPFVPSISGLFVLFVALGVMLLSQGLMMVSWALKHPPLVRKPEPT